MRPWHFLRFFGVLATSVVLCVSVMAGCGRTSLEPEDDFLTTSDGGSSGVTSSSSSSSSGAVGNCGPSNCSTGCCNASGQCQSGNDATECGSLGGACSDCTANGFDSCSAARVCFKSTGSSCDATTCPSGCCQSDGAGGFQCAQGDDNTACGISGETCANCEISGTACDITARTCSQAKCDASNCNGCCVGDLCLPGNSSVACGTQGNECGTCPSGEVCQLTSAGGGQCIGTIVCGPGTCSGCCDTDGTCNGGFDSSACGANGESCSVCGGNETCDPFSQTCEPIGSTCDAISCFDGCCAGGICVTNVVGGTLCGIGGGTCQSCGDGSSCDGAGTCTPTSGCNAQNCTNGCCVNDICAVGSQNTACGTGGQQCTNCTNLGETCQAQSCQPTGCSPANCNGCCQNGVCQSGGDDLACGIAGQQCNPCGVGQTCSGNACVTACSAANCPNGCCSGNTCVSGTANNACGSNGVSCTDCTFGGAPFGDAGIGFGGFCDGLVTPRRCSSSQSSCPATYGQCSNNTATPVTKAQQGVCTAGQLSAIQAACQDASSVICQAAIAATGGCGSCVTPFNHPFAENTGLYACAASFVTDGCRHATGCATDCGQTSCNGCTQTAEEQCYALVDSTNGQCHSFSDAATCADSALAAGQLCSQFSYADYASWLRAIGDHFCGNGP